MADRIELNPDWPWSRDLIVQGIRNGNRIYVSGQVSLDPDGNVVGAGDMAAQARQVFSNLEAVLGMGGASFEDLVKITTYLVDMGRYAEYSAVRKEVLSNVRPASTTVATPALVFPELLIEIEAIAEVRD